MVEIVAIAPIVEACTVTFPISTLREDPRESLTNAKTDTSLAAGKYMETELNSLLLVKNCDDPARYPKVYSSGWWRSQNPVHRTKNKSISVGAGPGIDKTHCPPVGGGFTFIRMEANPSHCSPSSRQVYPTGAGAIELMEYV